jgi:hypothetical protein
LAHSCIICWALKDESQPDHGVSDCHHGLVSDREYGQFCVDFGKPLGICWTCLCPQKVMFYLAGYISW